MRQLHEFEPPLRIVGKGGVEVRTIDDWRKYGAPAGGSEQWKVRRSAMELARAWVGGRKGPKVPRDLGLLLKSDSLVRDVALGLTIPEMALPLDAFGGKTRTSDLGAYGISGKRKIFIAVEAKADELFGNRTLNQEWRAASSEKSNIRTRIDRLCTAIFFKPLGLRRELDAELAPLRYQLLHGLAGAAFEAGLSGAQVCVFAVHEFASGATKQSALDRNQSDFDAFIKALGADPPTGDQLVRVGKVQAPNGREVETLIGKVRSTLG